MTINKPSNSANEEILQQMVYPLRLRRNVLLGPYTTFRIGGPTDLYVEVSRADELVKAVTAARALNLPYFLLGLGANVLFGDAGFRGLVICNKANHFEIHPETGIVQSESGTVIYPDLIEAAMESRLSGLEHFAGIPSTVGGALWQNLHFLSPPPERDRTLFIGEILSEARVLTEEGNLLTVDADYFQFEYDYSILHVRRDIVLSATFQLAAGDPESMSQIVEANLAWRRERHPPLDSEPSAGSIFKKVENIGAGRLIDSCGLKGTRVGGAVVTHRHANIIINAGGATAEDVCTLIDYIQETVEKETGYHLEPEIVFAGAFDTRRKSDS